MYGEEMDRLLEWLRDRLDDGEYATAETFVKEVFGKAGRYDDDMGAAKAKIAQMAESGEASAKEIQNLKARNYDLLMQVPVGENEGDGTVVETANEDGEVIHIDNLFTYDEEE